MIDAKFLYCPRCARRSLRSGKCLGCGFRGAGDRQLSPRQRLRPGGSSRRPEPSSGGDAETGWTWDGGLGGSDVGSGSCDSGPYDS